jgi:hypothetical protein
MNEPLKFHITEDYMYAGITGSSSFSLVGYIIGIRNPVLGFTVYDTSKITISCREYI